MSHGLKPVGAGFSGRSGGVGERLAAEQRDALDPVLGGRGADLGEHFFEAQALAAREGEHLGIAAARAAQRAALEP